MAPMTGQTVFHEIRMFKNERAFFFSMASRAYFFDRIAPKVLA
jgi:hypothetical protein